MVGRARLEGFWGTTVVSGDGRMFTVRGSRNRSEEVFLTARSLTSGLVLWQKRLRPAAEAAKIPHGGYVPGPKPGGGVKWIAIAGGALAVLSGEADTMQGIAVFEGRLHLAGMAAGSYDLKTGEAKAGRGALFGGEVGVLANRWVISGGRRLTEPEADVASPISSGFAMGVPGTTSLPACDAGLVPLATGGSAGSMLAVPADRATEGRSSPARRPGTRAPRPPCPSPPSWRGSRRAAWRPPRP